MNRKLKRNLSLDCCNISLSKLIVWACLFFGFIISPAYAGICFLPDCEDQVKVEADNSGAEECRALGYESDKSRVCPQYTLIDYCPENSNYIKCDYEGWCRLNGYVETTCESPYKLTDKCLNGTELYKECLMDDEAACKQENSSYVSQCDAGWALDPNHLCTISNNWGLCCNTCPGYNYNAATLPPDATAVASCDSCWGKRYIIADSGFNQCKGFWDCQDGCEIGSETCVSFGVTKCKTCKRCEAKCSNLTCPPGALCEYENCTQRYCDPTGCATGYTFLCETPEMTNCSELGYTTSASTCDGMGMVTCPFDANQAYCIPDNGDCCHVLCEGYDYLSSEIPSGYKAAGSCHCCGKDKYKISKNDCSGFVKLETCKYGVTSGIQTCQSGNETLYKECKSCPNATEYKVCPEGTVCTLDTCSNTYIPTGCATNNKYYCGTVLTDCEALGYTMLNADCAFAKTILYCPYDRNKVFCDPAEDVSCEYYCNAYPYTSIPSGYVEDARKVCCGTTYYQVKENPCSGYPYSNDDCSYGGDSTQGTCLSGTQTKYKQCKTCANVCFMSCPDGTICSLDSCSNTYCPTGCKTGYSYYCAVETDCDALGYRSLSSECAYGRDIMRCPYNQHLVYCN